jgi:DNA repair exonuclease SbcCD ATPase subunit
MPEIDPEQLPRLIAENARLAARLEEGEATRDRLATALAELREELGALRAQLGRAGEAISAAEERTHSLQQERDQLHESMSLANSQLRDEARPPVLSATEVSSLVDRLLQNLGSQLSGLSVREGELHLNVGFEKVGDQTGFVLPSSDAPLQSQENLHSISVRLKPEA